MLSNNIICFLDSSDVVIRIENWDVFANNEIISIWTEYIGRKVSSFLDIDTEKNSGYVNWKGTMFHYHRVENAIGSGTILFMTSGIENARIFEEAFDHISEGIQVYDQNGYLLFCNRYSEKIERTDRRDIIGKHLLDIYDLNEDFSTILNTLKTKNPVINRCDHFKNKAGEVITTMNSGYPLFVEDKLIGAIGLVQDASVSEAQQERSRVFEKYISDVKSQAPKKKAKYYTFKYYKFDDLIGKDPTFQEAIFLANKIAERNCSVLIYGETGTGKELFAQSIHSASERRNKPFVAVNCAAIPESLIEGILFGTEKGSFTGSIDKMGLFEQAEGGTLFLDEINSMGLHMQTKLLRVLQENKFRRVGGLEDLDCDVRVISSTNEEPFLSIEKEKIRKDVYYRISTVTINIPPLRERKSDIPILIQYFVEKLSRNYSKKVREISPAVLKVFEAYDWPGNVRELLHVIEHCFNTMESEKLQVKDLPKYLKREEDVESREVPNSKTLKDIMDFHEKEVLKATLKKHHNNVTKAAEELGVMRQSLQYRMKKYKL